MNKLRLILSTGWLHATSVLSLVLSTTVFFVFLIQKSKPDIYMDGTDYGLVHTFFRPCLAFVLCEALLFILGATLFHKRLTSEFVKRLETKIGKDKKNIEMLSLPIASDQDLEDERLYLLMDLEKSADSRIEFYNWIKDRS